MSVTKYPSEAVLHSKQTGEYPLFPHLKIFAVAFLQAHKLSIEKVVFWKKERKIVYFWPYSVYPTNYFQRVPLTWVGPGG